jgi:hypothetical protein
MFLPVTLPPRTLEEPTGSGSRSLSEVLVRRFLVSLTVTAGLLAATAGVAPSSSATTTCTRTIGYYKNHAGSYDSKVDLSAKLVAGLTSVTGLSLQGILEAPVRGDARLIAAKQLLAAAANGAPGGTGFTGEVGAAFYSLVGYFEGGGTGLTREELTRYAGVLDAYNNGRMGVPHC